MNSSISTSDPAVSARYIRRFLLCWLLLMLAPALFVVVVDPYQAIHRSFLDNPPFYKDNERYQVPGLIRHYLRDSDYNSVIIGSSLSSNFTTEHLQQHLGWNALNLSMRASTLAERSFVLQEAIRTGKVKHVLFEINPTDFMDDETDPRQDPAFPAYLYNDSLAAKWRYYFNQTIVLQAAAVLLHDAGMEQANMLVAGKPVFEADAWGFGINRWTNWLDSAERSETFSRYNTRDNLLALHADLEQKKPQQQRENWEWRTDYPFTGVRKNLVELVRNNPDVEFRIWFGAVSLLRYAGDINIDAINRHVEIRRIITNELSGLPNVKIYSFDNDMNIVGDLGNYMDVSHFSRAILEKVLQEIGRDTHRLHAADIDRFVETFRKNILEFEVKVPAE